jgi:hypothetical protein
MKFMVLIFEILLVIILCAMPSYSAERPQRLQSMTALAPVAAPAILSIIPAQAEPGSRVMLFGSGFGDMSSVFLGSVEIPASIANGKQVEFTVPDQLEPGLYALYLKRSDGIVSRAYTFTVQPLRPVLTHLAPDQISACFQGEEREVFAYGQNFSKKSLLFFDGAGIRSRLISSEFIVFSVPQVTGGLHPVMVKNSSENSSLPLALIIETRPVIIQVTVGDDHVSYYELIIDGKNFHQNSSLYVDGQRIGGRGGQEVSEREQVNYQDCTRLIYLRHPYSPVSKVFQIQVVNQDGEGSQVVSVNAP